MGVRKDAANPRGQWRCDLAGLLVPERAPLPTPPRYRARPCASPAGSPHSGEDALVIGARRRREQEAAEPSLILKIENQPLAVIGPAQCSQATAIDAVRHVQHFIRVAKSNQHFSTLGEPTGLPFVLEAHVGLLKAPEILVQRLVLRRNRVGIGGLPELMPAVG